MVTMVALGVIHGASHRKRRHPKFDPNRPLAVIASPGGVGSSQFMDMLVKKGINTNDPRNADNMKHALPEQVYHVLEEQGHLQSTKLIVVVYGEPAHALMSLCRRRVASNDVSYLRIHVQYLQVDTSGWSEAQNEAVTHCTIDRLHAQFDSDPLQIGRFYETWTSAANAGKHGIPIVLVPMTELLTDPYIQTTLNVTLEAAPRRKGKGYAYSASDVEKAESLTKAAFRPQ
jgi:hypothetical protein